jgi:hypothetical protein
MIIVKKRHTYTHKSTINGCSAFSIVAFAFSVRFVTWWLLVTLVHGEKEEEEKKKE